MANPNPPRAPLFMWVIMTSLCLLLINNFVFPKPFLPDLVNILLMLVFWGTIIYAIYRWIRGNRPKKEQQQQRNTDHGSARWSTEQEFAAAGNDAGEGLWIADKYMRAKSGHFLTVASPGSGKGACVILPNLLFKPFGSYVVTDPKGENACISARNQRESGQKVYILDPWDEQQKIGATHGIPASGFNPFDYIKANMEELRDNCELIARYLVPENPNTKDPYWDDRARTLIKTCLMHIVTDLPESEHNFWTLYKMVRVSGESWLNLLASMKSNLACDGLIGIAAEEFIGMEANGPTIGGIRSNAQNATAIFESPQLRASLSKSDLNPYDLTNGDCTVYIVIPERFIKTHGAWLRLVIGICLKACNAKPHKRVNFLIDEASVLGKMHDIENAYAFARGQNIVLWTFFQNLAQVKELYGENGMNSLISSATIFQAFGVRDEFTKTYISKALGEATYAKTTYSQNTSENGNSSGSSTSTFGRPLMTPDEVEACPDIIILSQGLKFLIRRMAYFQNRYDGLDWRTPWLSPEYKKMLKAGQTPPDLREMFQDRADPPPRVYA